MAGAEQPVFIVMGVAGAGKTTIGLLLAERLHAEFADADQFHSEYNKRKMASGHPLTDEDRAPWLLSMQAAIKTWLHSNVPHVLACSALKREYRHLLHVDDNVHFIYLQAGKALVRDRLKHRHHHYMKANMVDSQFETLEEPNAGEAVVVDASQPPEQVVDSILRALSPKRA